MDSKHRAAPRDTVVNYTDEGNHFSGHTHELSNESEHDLAKMVSDFLEDESSVNNTLWSSDSDSGFSDLSNLAERITFHKHTVDQSERDLSSTICSLVRSMSESNVQYFNRGPCNASCIRTLLVKHLRLYGYDAAVCVSKWQSSGKVPGGDHEYIDVIPNEISESTDRVIIDIDFQSHFEIARAIESYNQILHSLPIIYVGTLDKLNPFLQIMVEATAYSLKQNSMPLPPWRSLAYLRAKWHSPYTRKLGSSDRSIHFDITFDHKQCVGHLRRIKSSLQLEIDKEKILKLHSNARVRIPVKIKSRNHQLSVL